MTASELAHLFLDAYQRLAPSFPKKGEGGIMNRRQRRSLGLRHPQKTGLDWQLVEAIAADVLPQVRAAIQAEV